jgi:hypothetical protein
LCGIFSTRLASEEIQNLDDLMTPEKLRHEAKLLQVAGNHELAKDFEQAAAGAFSGLGGGTGRRALPMRRTRYTELAPDRFKDFWR